MRAGALLAASLSGGGAQALTRQGVEACARAAIEAGLKCAIAANVAARLSACMAAVVPYSLLLPGGAQVACEAARRLVGDATDRACAALGDHAAVAGLQTLADLAQPIQADRLEAALGNAVAAGIAAGIEAAAAAHCERLWSKGWTSGCARRRAGPSRQNLRRPRVHGRAAHPTDSTGAHSALHRRATRSRQPPTGSRSSVRPGGQFSSRPRVEQTQSACRGSACTTLRHGGVIKPKKRRSMAMAVSRNAALNASSVGRRGCRLCMSAVTECA